MKIELIQNIQTNVLRALANNLPITEEKLAKEAGTSRTSIRRVLAPLLEYGVIEQRKKSGISIKQPSLKEIVDLYDARTAMEGMAARLLAEKADPRTISKLRLFCRNMKVPPNRAQSLREKVIINDYHFHQTIIESCGNSYLHRIVAHFLILTLSFRYSLIRTLLPKDYGKLHEKVVSALASGNGVKAEMAMRSHIQAGKQEAIENLTGLKFVTNQ